MPAPADDPRGRPLAPDLARIRLELRALYDGLEADLAAAGPTCQLSGRCCRFAEYGHTLFLSGPEADLLLADAPPPVRSLDGGETCPWQDARGRCTAREARPLGCRVYYCDPGFEQEGHQLSERYIGRLKRIADQLGWAWDYAPLHRHLATALAEGRWPEGGPSFPMSGTEATSTID